jgi:3-deoxy-7-phosphoheptulonate synthase
MFLSPDKQGQMTIYQTSGNPYGHIIMRGGKQPNYHAEDIAAAGEALREFDLPEQLVLISATATARSSTAVSWRCAPISASRFAPPPPSPASWPRASCRKARRRWFRQPLTGASRSPILPELGRQRTFAGELAAATATRL